MPDASGLHVISADAFLAREREVLALDGPDQQVVLRLERDEARPAVPIGQSQRLHQAIRAEVRRADVEHLAGADELIERVQRLLERRRQVLAVDLVEVDVVGAQATETRVARLADVLPRRAARVRSRPDRHGALGGQHDLRTPAAQRLAADLLRDRAGVRVGGVEEVAAGLEVAIDQAQRFGLVTSPARHAERHGAEAKLGHTEAAAAERADAHGPPSYTRRIRARRGRITGASKARDL